MHSVRLAPAALQPQPQPQPQPRSELGRRAALAYLGFTTAVYVVLYGLANHWTSARADVGRGVFAWESAIPFVGWTIVPYLSICALFALAFFVDKDKRELQRLVLRLGLVLVAAVICYAVVPLKFTFVRPPTHGVIGLLFELLSCLDLPYNRAPSLHIGVLVVLWARLAPAFGGRWRLLLRCWMLLIAVSVLTTYQHHVLDVPAGAALGLLVLALTASRGPWNPQTAGAALRRPAPATAAAPLHPRSAGVPSRP